MDYFLCMLLKAYDLLKQNDQTIKNGEQALACDSTLFRAHLYIGRAYYRKARAIQLPLEHSISGLQRSTSATERVL